MSDEIKDSNAPVQENFFLMDRGERAVYLAADIDAEIVLPLTRDGFEALLDRCADLHKLPKNDSMRKVLVGWIHHIGNESNTTTIQALSKVLYKSVVNANTWTIDQEIKRKEQAMIRQAQEAAALAKAEEKKQVRAAKKIKIAKKPDESKPKSA